MCFIDILLKFTEIYTAKTEVKNDDTAAIAEKNSGERKELFCIYNVFFFFSNNFNFFSSSLIIFLLLLN